MNHLEVKSPSSLTPSSSTTSNTLNTSTTTITSTPSSSSLKKPSSVFIAQPHSIKMKNQSNQNHYQNSKDDDLLNNNTSNTLNNTNNTLNNTSYNNTSNTSNNNTSINFIHEISSPNISSNNTNNLTTANFIPHNVEQEIGEDVLFGYTDLTRIELPPLSKRPFYKKGIFKIFYLFYYLFKMIIFLFKFLISYIGLINHQSKQKKHCKILLEEKVENYKEYKEISLYLDQLEGFDLWKAENESKYYNYEQIESINYQLIAMLRKKDIHGLQWLLRAQLHRNIAGISHVKLYECHTGTKQLIEEYIELVSKALIFIKESTMQLSLEDKLKFFRDTSHAYGRSALLLSGGGGLSMYHLGVIKSLYDAKVLPNIISGSSAGSILASVLATRKDEDIAKCFESDGFKLDAFGGSSDTPERSAMRKLNRFLNNGVIMDVNKLAQCIRENIGDLTFEEAYKISGRVLNITVSGLGGYQTHEGLLNYLTAPNVLIWSAACASSCIPGFYKAVPLMAKDRDGNIIPYHNFPNQKYQDGTLFNDLPITRLAELFNVNFYIASQVNPHVLPFITSSSSSQNNGSIISNIINLCLSEIKYRIGQLYNYGLIPERFRWFELVLSQPYQADITIVPTKLNLDNFKKILSNPTAEYIKSAINQGLRKTYPHMNRIENMLKIEFTLDRCLREVRRDLFKNSPNVAMRLSKSSSLFDLESEDFIQQDEDEENDGNGYGNIHSSNHTSTTNFNNGMMTTMMDEEGSSLVSTSNTTVRRNLLHEVNPYTITRKFQ
ncbi:predicted protein [Naegleria gruberi]|uniref:Predicted protein n=1 Tax=Naegleria gruberi TaxID=5762 RepID=D2V1V5_NAEGR|nr:uncharacterized protein NAEGRDRAFT_62710 [Naegleria gruberi]EFC49228.1 predicted protein [Naegleria gruberi]|eukprot:XP_002681972.1 predicted protein [Naegleria gruberi strain NEG-M]